jgi:hypothetical protein
VIVDYFHVFSTRIGPSEHDPPSLFSFFGTPVYRVVVGDFPDPKYQLALGQQSFRGEAV